MNAALHVVLVAPEIPQNTGNIGRTCVATGCRLHLVGPLGFSLEDRYLRRAGLDYWADLDLALHDDWPACRATLGAAPMWLFTATARLHYTEVAYGPDDALVFGCESSGLPPALLQAHRERCVRLPMRATYRSLNLGNAAAIGVYEALRQQGFPGLE